MSKQIRDGVEGFVVKKQIDTQSGEIYVSLSDLIELFNYRPYISFTTNDIIVTLSKLYSNGTP